MLAKSQLSTLQRADIYTAMSLNIGHQKRLFVKPTKLEQFVAARALTHTFIYKRTQTRAHAQSEGERERSKNPVTK